MNDNGFIFQPLNGQPFEAFVCIGKIGDRSNGGIVGNGNQVGSLFVQLFENIMRSNIDLARDLMRICGVKVMAQSLGVDDPSDENEGDPDE